MTDEGSKPNHLTFSGSRLKSLADTVEDGINSGESMLAPAEKRASYQAQEAARRAEHKKRLGIE